jgi:hypothetical protein
LMLEKLWSYKVYEKGSGMVVTVSSPWLPISVVPGTILPPIWVTAYWAVQAVAVAVAVAVGEAVGVGPAGPSTARIMADR